MGKVTAEADNPDTMARKRQENRGSTDTFPVKNYWEDSRPIWEGDLGEDPLGADHAGRFAAIDSAWRAGLLGPDAEAAIITREQITDLVAPLALDAPDAIIDRLWAIAGRHLRPIHRKLLGSDLHATKKLMVELTSAVARLEDLLDRVPPVTREFMRASFERLPGTYRNCDRLDLDELERILPDLAHTSFFVAGHLERERKRPVHVLRRQTLKDAAETIEMATGNPVQRTWSEADRKKHTFKGVEGEVLRDFMRLVEPAVGEGPLVRLLTEIRRGERAGDSQ